MTRDPEPDPHGPEAVEVVNDRGVDITTTPIVLFPNARRSGLPVAVRLASTGQVVTVVPAGEQWQPDPAGASSLAQRLWITPAPAERR